MAAVKEEKEMPDKIRGMEITELSIESNERLKKEKRLEFIKLNKLTLAGIIIYLLFFSLISIILSPLQNLLQEAGYFAQLLAIAVLVRLIYKTGDLLATKLPLLRNENLVNMLKVYALINLFIAFLVLNGFDAQFFARAN